MDDSVIESTGKEEVGDIVIELSRSFKEKGEWLKKLSRFLS